MLTKEKSNHNKNERILQSKNQKNVKSIRLNLGCGNDYKEDYLNIDNTKLVKIDKLMNLNDIPYPFEDNSVDEIMCKRVVEYLEISLPAFMCECYRILKPNGMFHLEFANSFFWRDRLMFILGKTRADVPHRTKIINPSFLENLSKACGFQIVSPIKTGHWFIPKNASEFNYILNLTKRWF